MENTLDPFALYKQTALILGISCIVMSATLLALRSAMRNKSSYPKAGLILMTLALFTLGLINILEYVSGQSNITELQSLAIVVFAAATQMFLLFAAYMSLLSTAFLTKKRIALEIGAIIIFTMPAVCVSADKNPALFWVLFISGLIFYGSKLICNYVEYRRLMRCTKYDIENSLSDSGNQLLKWMNNTMRVIVLIGSVSVIAPMTNMPILIFYNIFIIIAYTYIYISIIRNVSSFSTMILNVASDQTTEKPENTHSNHSIAMDFMATRQKLLDEWLANKGYAVTGITASDVARQLCTNRTTLSKYLRDDLKTNYYEWIAMLRMEYAKQLLVSHPFKSVYEIAESVGIEDAANFRRVFSKYVGMPPTAYRRQNIK